MRCDDSRPGEAAPPLSRASRVDPDGCFDVRVVNCFATAFGDMPRSWLETVFTAAPDGRVGVRPGLRSASAPDDRGGDRTGILDGRSRVSVRLGDAVVGTCLPTMALSTVAPDIAAQTRIGAPAGCGVSLGTSDFAGARDFFSTAQTAKFKLQFCCLRKKETNHQIPILNFSPTDNILERCGHVVSMPRVAVLLTLCGFPLGASSAADERPWMDPTKTVDERVALLLPQLSLEEKVHFPPLWPRCIVSPCQTLAQLSPPRRNPPNSSFS